MKSISGIINFVLILALTAVAFIAGAGFGVQTERARVIAALDAATPKGPIDQAVIVDLKEIDKRERQMATRINAQQKQIDELFGRTEYLKGILEQVINFINGATTASPAPQGNAL